ncbi:hypothetical protein ACFX13_027955 [Malus domestica]
MEEPIRVQSWAQADLTRPATTQFRPQSDKPAETGAPSTLPIMAYPPLYSMPLSAPASPSSTIAQSKTS